MQSNLIKIVATADIVAAMRPYFEMTPKYLCALLEQAAEIAQHAKKMDESAFSTRLLTVTAQRMQDSVLEEYASRN